MRKQQVSDSTFPPLTAVALAQVTQQLHGLGRFLATAYSDGKAESAAGQSAPSAQDPPLTLLKGSGCAAMRTSVQ